MGKEGMSDRFPFSLAHTGLLEDAPEQREGDVALVGIRDTQFQGATLHKLVIAAAVGPVKPSRMRLAISSRRLIGPSRGIRSAYRYRA
jgi:hypothetical protein